MIRTDNVLIALPSYNEASVLSKVILDLQLGSQGDLLIVDDGSHDDTATIAHESQIKIVSHTCNRGAGAASQTAIEYARRYSYDVLILMDADGQHLTQDIRRMLGAIEQGKGDIIIGNRFDERTNEIPRTRIFFNFIANSLTNFFCKKRYADTQSGFRALNRKAIEKLDLKVDGFGFCSEMIIVGENQMLNIHEVPIGVKYTDYSMSKGQSFGKGVTTAFQFLWRVIFE